MIKQTFSYILHKDGTIDDSALELRAAAQKIAPEAAHTAIVMGTEADGDPVSQELAPYFQEIWKISHPDLSHQDAEAIRGILMQILPKGELVIVAHEHVGMDLSPGLSVKLDAAYIPDVIEAETVDNGMLKAIRQEFNGQVSSRVDYDIATGGVITIRPGSFKAFENKGEPGPIVDKTEEALAPGIPQTGRRFLETIEAENGVLHRIGNYLLCSGGSHE